MNWKKIVQKNNLGKFPQEISPNIQKPEIANLPKKRFSNRTKKITLSCTAEFYQELKKMAFEENCYQIEVLERALEVYKKNK